MNPPAVRWGGRPVVGLGELGPHDQPVSEGAGESLGIYHLQRTPGWLVKLYNRSVDRREWNRLDWLIALPDRIPPADGDILRRYTSWPVARVVDSFGTAVGVVLPEAPPCFAWTRTDAYLEVDVLAKPDHWLARRGLPVPSPSERLAICASIAAIGATLERQSLVYSDWSYSNAFWSPGERVAYLIDVDGIAPYGKPNMHQPNWQDPLTQPDRPADGYTDRYRLALLVARCVTGERELATVLHALRRLPGLLAGEVLLDVLLASERSRRPTVASLHAALVGMPSVRLPVHQMPMPALPAAASIGGTRTGVVAGGRNDGRRTPRTGVPAAPAATGRSGTSVAAGVVIVAVLIIVMAVALALCAAAGV
jgi:hypothetical protein